MKTPQREPIRLIGATHKLYKPWSAFWLVLDERGHAGDGEGNYSVFGGEYQTLRYQVRARWTQAFGLET